MREVKQSSILSYFTSSTSVTADDELRTPTSKQADVEEGEDVSDLSDVMGSDDDEMTLFLLRCSLLYLPPHHPQSTTT